MSENSSVALADCNPAAPEPSADESAPAHTPAARSNRLRDVEQAAGEVIGGLRMLRTSALAQAVHERCPHLSLRTVRSYLDELARAGQVLRRVHKGYLEPGPQLTGRAAPPVGESRFYAGFAEYLRRAESLQHVIELGGSVLHEVGGTPDVLGRRAAPPGARLGCTCEIVSGELKLKPETAFAGLGQACGYQLFSHAVWLAVPRTGEPSDLARLECACRAHNVGLALFSPEGEPGWEARVRPIARAPDLAYANAKLARYTALWEE